MYKLNFILKILQNLIMIMMFIRQKISQISNSIVSNWMNMMIKHGNTKYITHGKVMYPIVQPFEDKPARASSPPFAMRIA